MSRMWLKAFIPIGVAGVLLLTGCGSKEEPTSGSAEQIGREIGKAVDKTLGGVEKTLSEAKKAKSEAEQALETQTQAMQKALEKTEAERQSMISNVVAELERLREEQKQASQQAGQAAQ
jgi:hypothetical protein